eukprot:scaffold675659_cov32-Prasinocladus_malaysianus.AAC.1
MKKLKPHSLYGKATFILDMFCSSSFCRRVLVPVPYVVRVSHVHATGTSTYRKKKGISSRTRTAIKG